MRRTALILGTVIAAWVAAAGAQQGEYRAVDSPFQEDFPLTINSDLKPMVEVEGVRWTRFGIYLKGDREIEPDKDNPVTVEFDVLNTGPEGVRVLVIALLEDVNGRPLERIECDKVSANSERLKESVQKFKISGSVLQAVRRVYLFCELEH